MVGLIVVAHNGLGDSLLTCVQHVLGKVPSNLMVLSVSANDDPQRREEEGRALIKYLDQGDGVLLLTDMFGATPSNIARRLCEPGRVIGVAGVNLPMLLRVVCYNSKSLDELAKIALEGGRECIVSIDSALKDGCDATTGSTN